MDRSTHRIAAVALAWLAVLAPATGVAAPPDRPAGADVAAPREPVAEPPVPANNTSARLVLPDYRVERSDFETVTVGTASTLQTGAYGVRAAHRRIAIEQKFSAADTVGEKRSVVDRALIDLNRRSRALKARERATLRAYSDGNISTATMVRRLARIDARARELAVTLALVRDLTDRIGTRDFDARIRDIGGLIGTLTGPVRERVARALSGEATPVRVHVVATDEGVVLSMLTGGRYVREATDWSNRNRSGTWELETNIEARNHAGDLYPWVVSQRGRTSVAWKGRGVWKWVARHSQGELVAYIDASTTDVFREIQWLNVEEMPSTTTLVVTRNGLRIVLERTYTGGPLRIFVEDAATDAVVNADVTVGGHELGRIGADGVVMTLEPRLPYAVNVTANGSSVVVTVERPLNASAS